MFINYEKLQFGIGGDIYWLVQSLEATVLETGHLSIRADVYVSLFQNAHMTENPWPR